MYEIPDTGNLRAGELSVKYFLHLRVLDRPLQEVEIRRVNTRFGHLTDVDERPAVEPGATARLRAVAAKQSNFCLPLRTGSARD